MNRTRMVSRRSMSPKANSPQAPPLAVGGVTRLPQEEDAVEEAVELRILRKWPSFYVN